MHRVLVASLLSHGAAAFADRLMWSANSTGRARRPEVQQRVWATDCQLKMYGGSVRPPPQGAYGGWTFCKFGPERPTVISVGIGGDVSFDAAVAREHGATVFCFDPTISRAQFAAAVGRQNLASPVRDRLTFFPFGLGGQNDVLEFYRSLNPKIRSLSSTPGNVGFDPKPYLRAPILRIHPMLALFRPLQPTVLKIDIEGAEWSLFQESDTEMRNWLATSAVSQIAIEFHDRMLVDTRRRVARRAVVRVLARCGFAKRHQSKSLEEVLFVRTQVVPSC